MTDGRLEALESIRGMAALSVVFLHLVLTFWPDAFETQGAQSALLKVIAQSPLRVVYDGSFAVHVFFVLSGVVLSVGYFQRPSLESLSAAAIRRYFRLTLPILVSVLLAYSLLVSGWFDNQAAADLLGRGPDQWLRKWYTFSPSLPEALAEGTYGVYVGFSNEKTYNSVLWTMSIELFGSFFVFAFLALAGRLRRRWVIYLILGIVAHRFFRPYLEFLIGILLSDIYVQSQTSSDRFRLGPLSGTIILVTGLCLPNLQARWFDEPIAALVMRGRLGLQTLGATLVIATGLFCPRWSRILEFRPLVGLGRISFSLYLLHVPIICSVGCLLFNWLYGVRNWSQNDAAIISSIVILIVSLSAAWVMYRTIDRRAIDLGKWVYQSFRPARPVSGVQ